MRLNSVAFPIVLILALSIPSAQRKAFAGEVVTDDLRQSARHSIQNEDSRSFQPSPDTVAVLYFKNKTGRPDLDPLQKGIAVMLITDLAKVKTIRVVERAQLQALVEELNLGASGLVAPGTAPRVGRLLDARFIVAGDLGSVPPEQIAIAGNLLEMPPATVLGTPSSQGVLENLLRMEKEVLFEIIRLLQIELTPEEREELRKPITLDFKALLFFSQGIESSDRGAYEEAAAYYREALQHDPEMGPAVQAVDELTRLRLIAPFRDTLLRNLHQRISFNEGPVQGPITRREFSDPVSIQGPAGTADVQIRW